MATPREHTTDNEVIKLVVGGVISFIGICFVAVTLWLGTSVNNLTKSNIRLEAAVQQLQKSADRLGLLSQQNRDEIQDLKMELITIKSNIKRLQEGK